MAASDRRGDEELHCLGGLLRYDTVAQGCQLSRAAETAGGGHPAVVEALHPFHEAW